MELKYRIIEFQEDTSAREKKSKLHRVGIQLLAQLLEKYKINYNEVEILKKENGKPYIKGKMNIDFSISHTEMRNLNEGFVCCGISFYEGPLGVDAEPLERRYSKEHIEKFSRRYFSKNERDFLRDNNGGFSKVWTAKEAYYKCIGVGKFVDLRELDGLDLPKDMKMSVFNIDKYIVSVCHDAQSDVNIIL